MRVAAVFAAWLVPLAMAAAPAAADDAPVTVPPAYKDGRAPAALARDAAQVVVRVAVDAAQVRATRPRENSRAAVPEQSAWTSLLCGLVAVALIARRKTRWPQS